MNKQQALEQMVMPSARRRRKPRGGVIQICISRACNRSCYGCTQGSNLVGIPNFMSPEHFEQAVITLKDYFGVVGVFGGNPCLNPKFETICEILRKHIPQERCGLWANQLFGTGRVCHKTFNPAISNLNVHLDKVAYQEIRKDWPESRPFGLTRDSRHPPPYVAIQDIIQDESECWELIAGCDINQHWSAMITTFRRELRGWFCEIAGAQSVLHQGSPEYPDTGVSVESGWWRLGLETFEPQISFHCPACGIPLRGNGELACATGGTEQTSFTHQDIYLPKLRNRSVQIVTDRAELGKPVNRVIDYLGNALK